MLLFKLTGSNLASILCSTTLYMLDENVQVRDKTLSWPEIVTKGGKNFKSETF